MTPEFKIPYKCYYDIPMDEFKNLHKEYWKFISENDLYEKPRIVNLDGNQLYIMHKCFACSYADNVSEVENGFTDDGPLICCYCPIKKWRNTTGASWDSYGCEHLDSEYEKWCDIMTSEKEKSECAMKIANLEWEDLHNEL